MFFLIKVFIYTINLLFEFCVLLLKFFVLSSCFICMDGLVAVLFGCFIQIISTYQVHHSVFGFIHPIPYFIQLFLYITN